MNLIGIILVHDRNPGEFDFAWFDLARGLSYRGFELSGVDCVTYTIRTLAIGDFRRHAFKIETRDYNDI